MADGARRELPGRESMMREPKPVGRDIDHESDPGGEIVIVGPCASGKSTLVTGLVELGYRARVVGQEHSEIGQLWRHHHPTVVIGLQASLETVRSRRGRAWPAAVYEQQQRRLAMAMAAANVILDTGELSQIATLAAAAATIRGAGLLAADDDGQANR